MTKTPLTEGAAYKKLILHYSRIHDFHLRDLFALDATRGQRLTTEALDIYFDYSKNRITDETLNLLLQ